MTDTRKWLAAGALAILLSGCKMFDVEAPGRIADADLNDPDAVSGIVAGMSYDLSQAMRNTNQTLALAAGELYHSGSYNLASIPNGIILPEDINDEWEEMMQARWVGEHGIARLQGMMTAEQFSRSPLIARAYLLTGFASRLIGEAVCQTVVEGGSPEPNTMEFDRGIAAFTKAIEIGTAAGNAGAKFVTAAYAGRASLKAWKGDWAGAVADAQRVPISFEYDAPLMAEGIDNDTYYETHDRGEFTVYNTDFASTYFNPDGDDDSDDPRVPWVILRTASGAVRRGANGSTPWYQQQKYNDRGADVPLVKGTEMLVLRAEAALRASPADITTATQLMNQARAYYGMQPLDPSATATLADAWKTLQIERGATVWLENRRLWDLRRWFAEGTSSPAYHPFLADRPQGRCVPISENERNSNPNIPRG